MKVYVFTAHQAVDCEVLERHTEVFYTKEAAIAMLKEWRDDEMEYANSMGWNISDDAPDHFEAYEDGRYATNHTEFIVEECEVQGSPDDKKVEVEEKKSPLDDIVTITCYNKTEQMKRGDAIKFYAEGMNCCEGSERDRYTNIYMQLMDGRMECYDDVRL